MLLLLGTLWFGGLVVRGAMRSAHVGADISVVSNEARQLHAALVRFHEQNGYFPASDVFDRASAEPLKRRGYYEGAVSKRLAAGAIDAYVVTAGDGQPREFWLEMSLARDPSVRFLVSRSDDAPLGGGAWRDGAFIHRDGELKAL